MDFPPVWLRARGDAMFYRWVTRAREQDAAGGAGKLVLDELGRLTASPSSGAMGPAARDAFDKIKNEDD